MFRVILCMGPLEKVPFATFYPRWKYLCGTYFFKKKDFFKWTHYLSVNVIYSPNVNLTQTS